MVNEEQKFRPSGRKWSWRFLSKVLMLPTLLFFLTLIQGCQNKEELSPELLRKVKIHGLNTLSFIYSWEKSIVAALDPDGSQISIYNTLNNSEYKISNAKNRLTSIVLIPNSSFLAGADNTGKIFIWNIDLRKIVSEIRNPAPIGAVSYNLDSNSLIAFDSKYFLDFDSVSIWDFASGSLKKRFLPAGIKNYQIVGVSKDMSKLAIGLNKGVNIKGHSRKDIFIIDMSSNQIEDTLHLENYYTYAISRDFRYLASFSSQKIELFSVDGMTKIAESPTSGWLTYGVSFSDDSRFMACATENKLIRIFFIPSMKIQKVLTGHQRIGFRAIAGNISFLSFDKTGSILLSGNVRPSLFPSELIYWNLSANNQRTIR